MENPFLTNQHTGMTEDEQDETWQIQNLAMDANFRDCPGTNMVLGFIYTFPLKLYLHISPINPKVKQVKSQLRDLACLTWLNAACRLGKGFHRGQSHPNWACECEDSGPLRVRRRTPLLRHEILDLRMLWSCGTAEHSANPQQSTRGSRTRGDDWDTLRCFIQHGELWNPRTKWKCSMQKSAINGGIFHYHRELPDGIQPQKMNSRDVGRELI